MEVEISGLQSKQTHVVKTPSGRGTTTPSPNPSAHTRSSLHVSTVSKCKTTGRPWIRVLTLQDVVIELDVNEALHFLNTGEIHFGLHTWKTLYHRTQPFVRFRTESESPEHNPSPLLLVLNSLCFSSEVQNRYGRTAETWQFLVTLGTSSCPTSVLLTCWDKQTRRVDTFSF